MMTRVKGGLEELPGVAKVSSKPAIVMGVASKASSSFVFLDVVVPSVCMLSLGLLHWYCSDCKHCFSFLYDYSPPPPTMQCIVQTKATAYQIASLVLLLLPGGNARHI